MTDFYIASCHPDGGIYFCFEENGNMRIRQVTPCDRPMFMELSGNRLYTVLRQPHTDENSGILSFEISQNGFLGKPSDGISTWGIVGCHLTVRKSGVFVANYLSGSVFRTPDLLVAHKGHGKNPDRQETAHPHCTVSTPDGKYLCVADLGLDTVFVYDDELKEVSRVKFPDGKGPRHLVFSQDGRVMYGVCELDSTVAVLDYCDGRLKYVASVSTLPKGFEGFNTAAAIRMAAPYLYVSNRGHNSIAVFDISRKIPEFITTVNVGGDSPRDFNIQGDRLICANENSDNVTLFNMGNGIPNRIEAELKIPKPLCVIFGREHVE